MFSKRLTLENITSGLTQIVTDLQKLAAQNKEEISVNETQISALKAENDELAEELQSAANVKSNIEALLKPRAS